MPRILWKRALRGALFPVSFAPALWAAPAVADCLEDVAALEQRIEKLERDARTAPAKPGAPSVQEENWFGAPPSLEGARSQLDNARTMAEDGKEGGCRSHLGQARRIVDGLSN